MARSSIQTMTGRNKPSRLRVKMHDVRFGVHHLQVPSSLCTRASHVPFKAFHLLAVKVGIAEHCLREGLDDVDASQLKVEERNEREEDADG
eukprot:2952574-Pleurochrysis_carterae.AAC.1